MKCLSKLSLLILLTPLHVPCAAALPRQETVDWSTFGSLLGSIRSRASDLKQGQEIDAKAAELLDGITSNVQVLLTQWGKDVSDGPQAYYAGLAGDDDLLKNLLDKKPPKVQMQKVLQAVADDLRIKAAHCVKSPEGWAALIKVVVITRKGGKVVPEYEVWFVPLGWADVVERWQRFPKLSSPTENPLAPGVYMMRASNGASVRIEIGGDGKNQHEIDLIAP
jgi:hypothetical protein